MLVEMLLLRCGTMTVLTTIRILMIQPASSIRRQSVVEIREYEQDDRGWPIEARQWRWQSKVATTRVHLPNDRMTMPLPKGHSPAF